MDRLGTDSGWVQYRIVYDQNRWARHICICAPGQKNVASGARTGKAICARQHTWVCPSTTGDVAKKDRAGYICTRKRIADYVDVEWVSIHEEANMG